MKPRLKPKGQRAPADRYYTPPQLARFICSRLVDYLGEPRVIVEPHAGRGAFVAAARLHWPDAKLLALDINGRAKRFALAAGADVFAKADWLGPGWSDVRDAYDLVLGNPPYLGAQQHLERALERVRPLGFVAFLLRLTFFGSEERNRTLWNRPGLRYLLPIYPRPRFIAGGGLDFTDYGVFVWQRDFVGRAEVLPNLHWKED